MSVFDTIRVGNRTRLQPKMSVIQTLLVIMFNDMMQEITAGPIEIIPEKMFERQLVKEGVVKLLNTLTKREAEIVRLYFGLNGETPRSFEEIGKVLKLSRERIRQIYGIALLKLQQNTLVDSLKFYVV